MNLLWAVASGTGSLCSTYIPEVPTVHVVTSKYPSKKTIQAPSSSSSSSSPDQAPTHHFKMGNLVRAASLYPVLPKRIRRDRCWVVGCRVHTYRWPLAASLPRERGKGKGGKRGKYMDPCLRNRRQATIGPTCRTNDLFVLFFLAMRMDGWAAVQDDGAVCEKISSLWPQPSPAQSSGTMWIASIRI